MRRTTRRFETSEEAKGFLAGVEWVNDSAITAWVDVMSSYLVHIEDEDYDEDEDEKR